MSDRSASSKLAKDITRPAHVEVVVDLFHFRFVQSFIEPFPHFNRMQFAIVNLCRAIWECKRRICQGEYASFSHRLKHDFANVRLAMLHSLADG